MASLLNRFILTIRQQPVVARLVKGFREGQFKKAYPVSLQAMERQRNTPRKPGPIRVVYIAQYLPSWNKISYLIDSLAVDPRFDPVILCVPSSVNRRELRGNSSEDNEVYSYFTKRGYKTINALLPNGGWFDLRELEPDFVFHSRPYNNYMPAEYSSGRIAKYSKLCSLLYGVCYREELAPVALNDDYYKDVAIHFAQSKLEKDYFLKRFSLGVERGLQNAIFSGMPVVDSILDGSIVGHGLWGSLSDGVRVMWTPRWSTDSTTGGSHFLELKDSFIAHASSHPEIMYVLRPHPLMFPHLLEVGKMDTKEVEEFKARCASLENVLLDEGEEYLETLVNADILVTDLSSIIVEFFVTQKPIILCSYGDAELPMEAQMIVDTLHVIQDDNEIWPMMDSLIQENDGLDEKKATVLKGIYGDTLGRSTEIIMQELIRDNK